jgi:hypothetical protein
MLSKRKLPTGLGKQQMVHSIIFVSSFFVLSGGLLVADEPSTRSDDTERNARLDYMKAFVADFTVTPAGDRKNNLVLTQEPVQRWTNPIRNRFSDGCVFLWLDGERPMTAVNVSIRGEGMVWLEAANLTATSLDVTRRGTSFWTPKAAEIIERPLVDAAPPGDVAARRLVQMRRIAERFTVRTNPGQEPSDLRLMPQPYHQYQAASRGIVDGALFAFVETTDPELLLVIEAVKPMAGEPAVWRYSLNRMTSRPIVVELDGTPVYNATNYIYQPRLISDSYLERHLGVYRSAAK